VAEAPDRFITAWDDETDASGANLIAAQDAVTLAAAASWSTLIGYVRALSGQPAARR